MRASSELMEVCKWRFVCSNEGEAATTGEIEFADRSRSPGHTLHGLLRVISVLNKSFNLCSSLLDLLLQRGKRDLTVTLCEGNLGLDELRHGGMNVVLYVPTKEREPKGLAWHTGEMRTGRAMARWQAW